MDQKERDLIHYCQEFDIFEERKAITRLHVEACKQFKEIKQEAFQWLKELREQKNALSAEKQNRVGPLLPQTPTMKRKLRKRKIPTIEDEEKENTAITRTRRAASQIANSKFHQQLHLPVKMRRPSSPKTSVASNVAEPKQKRTRVAKNLRVRLDDGHNSDSDVSTTSTRMSYASNVANISITSTTSEVAKTQTHKNKATVEPCDSDMVITETEGSPRTIKKATKLRTRAQKKAAAEKITESSDQECVPRTRQNRRKGAPKEMEAPPPPTEEPVESKQRSPKTKAKMVTASIEEISNEECASVLPEAKNVEIENIELTTKVKETESKIVVSRLLHVTLQRLPDNLSSTVNVTPEGSIVSLVEENAQDVTKVAGDDMEITMAAFKTKTPTCSTNLPAQLPSTGLDLVALTPHLKGKVKERVIAVEKSLKKEEPVSKLPLAKKAMQKAATPQRKVSVDLFESAESSPEKDNSPTRFGEKRRISSRDSFQSAKKVKRSHSTPSQPIIVKLFDEAILRKKSFSSDNAPTTASKTQTLTTGRSRVLTGVRTFAKPTAREAAQTALLEEEKKRKAEEVQRNLDRAQDASKKKEEQLRAKKEQKRRENEEKRARAVLAQELRMKEQEEAIRLEREREERKAALQRAREEKELQEKELRREQRKQKQAEREQRRKEEEVARIAKNKEIAQAAAEKQKEFKQREEERKAEKGGWAAPPGKVQVATKTAAVHPTKQLALAGTSKNTLNETFEVLSKPAEKEVAPHKNQQKVVATISNSYAMTPSRDEMSPLPPKNPNDYGIDDVNEDDPSDDDEQPKKKIPDWARNMRNNVDLKCADWISVGLRNRLFGTRVFKPTAEELFGSNARRVHRRSSAIWNTPPNIHHQSLCASFISD